jgi:hypothetical protein
MTSTFDSTPYLGVLLHEDLIKSENLSGLDN